MSKPIPVKEMTNAGIHNILNDMKSAFPSINFNVEVEPGKVDKAVYDEKLFEELMPEIAVRIWKLAIYQKLDMSRPDGEDIFHKLLMQISELEELDIECYATSDAKYGSYFSLIDGDFNEGDFDSTSVDRICITRTSALEDEDC